MTMPHVCRCAICRQEMTLMGSMLMAQSTHRLGELQRFKAMFDEALALLDEWGTRYDPKDSRLPYGDRIIEFRDRMRAALNTNEQAK